MITNKEYKDSVFRFLFNKKEKAIELYNVLYGTNYDIKTTPVELVTLEDVLFTPRKNDLAFLLDGKFIILVEHQSTINKNMPLRCLLYIARLYEKIISNENIYKYSLLKLPKPEFVVLYNGIEDLHENRKPVKEVTLKLSSAFEVQSKEKNEMAPLELIVKVVDIRYSKQHSIIKKKSSLQEYSYFIQRVQDYKIQEKTNDEAIQLAITDCIKKGILKEFLEENSSEVLNMLTLEYNEELAKKVQREEAREEGLQEGLREGLQEGIQKGIQEGIQKGIEKGMEKGIEKGMEKGIEKGIEETTIKFIRNALKKNLAISDIAELTGLTEEEISAWKKLN